MMYARESSTWSLDGANDPELPLENESSPGLLQLNGVE